VELGMTPISPKPEILPATEDDIARFYGGIQFSSRWVGKAMHKGSLVAGVGGAFEVDDGIWYGFLEIPISGRPWSVYRHTLRLIDDVRSAGASVIKATCDTRVPRAKEFMGRLGFVPTDEKRNNEVVWCLVLKS
jgi:hypothetical protein